VAGTGRPVKFAAWDLFRIDGGKIVEITQYCDLFTILNQIGALPTASPPDAYEEIDKPAS
jgi:ketosteroid isomerase-like protein